MQILCQNKTYNKTSQCLIPIWPGNVSPHKFLIQWDLIQGHFFPILRDCSFSILSFLCPSGKTLSNTEHKYAKKKCNSKPCSLFCGLRMLKEPKALSCAVHISQNWPTSLLDSSLSRLNTISSGESQVPQAEMVLCLCILHHRKENHRSSAYPMNQLRESDTGKLIALQPDLRTADFPWLSTQLNKMIHLCMVWDLPTPMA